MLSLRSFMFERVYLAADAKPNQQRAHAIVRRIFGHLVDEGRPAQEATDYVAGMTDRFALAYAARLDG
jgi:dGTP triphosphohydrolase